MENQNLNVAPTLKELDKAGFTSDFDEDENFVYTKTICDNLNLNVFFENNEIHSLSIKVGGHFIKNVEPTKAAINAEFKHFNQPLPQWEKAQPKVGEVWKNEFYTFLIIKDEENNVLKLDGETLQYVDWINYETANYDNFKFDKFTKIADSLEDYYKEKFTK